MSNSPSTTSAPRAPLSASLITALAVALTVGTLFGLGDAIVADVRLYPPSGLLGYLGCYAAAIMSYCGLAALVLVPLALLTHPYLSRLSASSRMQRLLFVGLSIGLFAEIYWWTRPYVFYGHSSVSKERLIAAAVQGLVAVVLAVLSARLLLRLPRTFHLALRTLAVLAIAGGLLFIRSEQSLIESRGTLNERNRDLPNVLLVIVDALRADHLSCYGNTRIKTPHIDALAERGVLVENCFAQAPYTLTSFGSILTGKYPRRHGLVAQLPGVQMEPNVTLPFHLKTAKLKGSAERLRDEDFAAGTFMTGAVSHGSGLARGFDAYSEAMMGHDLVQMDSQWSRFRSELLVWLFKNKLQQRVDSSLVVTTARSWLREHKDRRWMAMVHLYSTHTPYDPPDEYREPYIDPTYDGKISAFYAEHRYALEAGEYEPTEADVEQIRDLYAAGAAQADGMIGELVAELESLGVLDDTLIIFTSDHGEDLGEWRPVGMGQSAPAVRFWEHNHMWQTNLRIPLILSNTRLLQHGTRLNDLIESVDILPTLCDLLGLELPTEEGVMEVDGHSFLPAIRGTQSGEVSSYRAKEYSFSENNFYFSIQNSRWKLIVPREFVESSDPELPLDQNHWMRFYDLQQDPSEEHNLYSRTDERVLELWTALRAYNATMPKGRKYRITARDREQERLFRSIGYAEGIVPGVESTQPKAAPQNAPAPKDESDEEEPHEE